MAIPFNSIPSAIRVPLVAVEFDSSRAQSGPQIQPYKMLVIGQRLSTGTVAELVPQLVTSANDAAVYFGKGSMLHGMAERLFAVNRTTEAWFVAQNDAGAGVQATKTITVTGPATASGTLYIYIAGRRVTVGVTSGDAQNTIATAINTALVAAVDLLPVTSTVATNIVTLTSKHKGEEGNRIDVRFNYFQGETTPAGVTLVAAAGVTGTLNPTISAVWAVIGEEQYNVLLIGYSDAANYALIDTELASRWGPLRMNDGVAALARQDTLANLVTYAGAGVKNSKHISVLGYKSAPIPPWEWASSYGGLLALYGQADPARPFQTLAMSTVLGPALVDRFTIPEQDILLNNGIATHVVGADGIVQLGRAITTYQKNTIGAADTAYLDITSPLTLSYMRFDVRNVFATKYPRHKLANDGTNFAAGQPIMTPSIGKAEMISIARGWEELGLMENVDQFKRDLVVERNALNPNRLDFLIPPDLVNQLMTTGMQIGFLL